MNDLEKCRSIVSQNNRSLTMGQLKLLCYELLVYYANVNMVSK